MAKWAIIALLFGSASALTGSSASAQTNFCFHPPGQLDPRDGTAGDTDRTVFVPDMVFPLRVGPDSGLQAHLNSQIFGYGGQYGPGGSLGDKRNYEGCWQDTFCEGKRSWKMPLCPLHVGHQGDDIRPNGPEEDTYQAVAFENGYLSLVTKNTTVVVVGDDGTECRYLHMDPESIKADKVGMKVVGGETLLGRVSNWMGGVHSGTSTHLHFDCSQTFDLGSGKSQTVHVPVYTSLIVAYAKAWRIDGLAFDDNRLATGSPYEKP